MDFLPKDHEHRFLVQWTMDVDGINHDTPMEAARYCQSVLADPGNQATRFTVLDRSDGTMTHHDLD